MDPRKLLERIERLSALKRLEAEDFIDFLASRETVEHLPMADSTPTNALEQLLAHPLGIKNFQAPLRDEIYARD